MSFEFSPFAFFIQKRLEMAGRFFCVEQKFFWYVKLTNSWRIKVKKIPITIIIGDKEKENKTIFFTCYPSLLEKMWRAREKEQLKLKKWNRKEKRKWMNE